jgi:hypothetical protein
VERLIRHSQHQRPLQQQERAAPCRRSGATTTPHLRPSRCPWANAGRRTACRPLQHHTTMTKQQVAAASSSSFDYVAANPAYIGASWVRRHRKYRGSGREDVFLPAEEIRRSQRPALCLLEVFRLDVRIIRRQRRSSLISSSFCSGGRGRPPLPSLPSVRSSRPV